MDQPVPSQPLVIETRYEPFLASIEPWNGSTPSFQQCVASGLFIAATMGETERFCTGIAIDHRAQDFDRYDVTDWATGTPLPDAFQASVVSSIAARLRECRIEARKRLGITDPPFNDGAPSADGFEE
jgi:hypothetical protein